MTPIVIPLTSGGSSPSSGGTSSLTLGRLLLGVPLQWQEQTGDPLATQGGAIVPGNRAPLQFAVTLATIAADGNPDGLTNRLTLRRQLRSLLNNTDLKLQGFLYLVYSDDPEQNGWYAPDQLTLQDITGSSGLATGFWQMQGTWYLVGHRRTHREARQAWMKDLRTGQYDRDTLGWLRSTDFSALPALALSVLPHGATGAALTVSGQAIAGAPLATGRDGGQCTVVQGLSDLQVIGYERPEASLNLSDVIVYDRMGAGDAPATGPGATWQEAYGPDWPWNWQTAGQPADTPVLANGLVRVRWDTTSTPGFRVDVWNGSAYVEQGKMIFYRHNAPSGYDNTWVSAGLHTENGWTPERAVMSVVLANSADSSSRERVFVTVQRGETGVTFECYAALETAGTQSDVALEWSPALNAGSADLNGSAFKSGTQTLPPPAGTGAIAATAGTGAGTGNSGTYPSSGTLGAASFSSSENYVAIVRCPTTYNTVGAYQTTLTVLQAANAQATYQADSAAYGALTNGWLIWSLNAAGYLSVGVNFAATATDQVIEAESVRNTGSGSTSQVADASASGGLTVQDTHGQTLAHRTGFPATTDFGSGGSSFTQSVTTVAVGDLLLVTGVIGTSGGPTTVTNVSGGNATGWAKAWDYNDIVNSNYVFVWYATVSTVGTATITVTPSASTTHFVEVAADSFASGLAANVTWTVDTASAQANTASTTITYPALIPTAPGEIYYGFENSGVTASAGSTPGYTYTLLGGGAGHIACYNLGPTAGTVTQPTASQGSSVFSETIGVLFRAIPTVVTLTKSSTTLAQAKYRVFARVKVDASTTGSFQASIGGVSGPVAYTSATTYTWVDLGDILAPSAALTASGWRSAGTGNVYMDRLELFLVEDRVRAGATFGGCRDVGQAALFDARQLGAVVAR